VAEVKESEQIDFARAYVALSNAHDLERILPMFADNALYRSSNVGEFKGRDAIGRMMSDFFDRFPNVYWSVEEYRCAGAAAVVFDFAMTATEPLTGESIERLGLERIEFTGEGLIERLEVMPRN